MQALFIFVFLRLVSTAAPASTLISRDGTNATCQSAYHQVAESGDCECRDGLHGLNCRMCTLRAEQEATDACASALGPGYQCVTSFTYDTSSRDKTYTCTLSSNLQALIPDGAIDISCERSTQGHGSCQAAVYLSHQTVASQHMLDCNLTQCAFVTGRANVKCGAITCTCGPTCSAMTKSLVEGLSGQPAQIHVDESAEQLSLEIENSPLPLSATCKVAACQLPGTSDGPDTDIARTTSNGETSRDATGQRLAVVACLALATLLLVGMFSFCCCVVGRGRDQTEETLETELLKVTARSAKMLAFSNISCFVAAKKKSSDQKVLLNAISGSVARGQVLGLLGPSGSGKTTLLNALAAMQNGNSTFTGELLLDGSPVTKEYRRIAAYVQQDDSLFSTLTVGECIAYSAQLRLPLSMTNAAKAAMVSRVITELNLGHIVNSRIGSVGGSTIERGISGGERRRVSIGMELVTSPQILILDEPTSGLDSSSAHSVVKLLKELASHDRIVILSIHQPSSRSFLLLDKIMLLAKGQLLYHGPPADSKQHFVDMGFHCPEDDNVADYILDVASDTDNVATIQSHHDNAPPLTVAASAQPQPEVYFPTTPLGSPAYKAPFGIDDTLEARNVLASFQGMMLELRVLFTRTAQNIFRHRSLLIQHVALSVMLGLIGGLIFNNVTDNLAGFQNRMGAFFFILTFFGFASLSSMDLFIAERPIFLRETGAKYYSAFSYFLAKMTLDALLLRVLPASIFACIFYWLMALQADFDRFMMFVLTLVLFNVAAGSISVLVGVVSKRVGSANLAATVVLLIMLLFGGFLLNSETMPRSVGWLKHFSIFGYAFEILMVNELEGTVLSFDAPGYPAVPVYGELYLKTLGMEYTQRYYDVAALALGSVILQTLAYFFLSMQVPSNRAM